jgi:hypothetical protein
MPTTYTQIGSGVTVGVLGAASIDFSSIPSTYTDLVLKVSARLTAVTDFGSLSIAFNGSTSSFSNHLLQGDGSTTVSAVISNFAGGVGGTLLTSNTFNNVEIYIPNYAGSANKAFIIDAVVENNATAARNTIVAGSRSSTAAINQITLTSASGDFAQYSTAYLYGVSNA